MQQQEQLQVFQALVMHTLVVEAVRDLTKVIFLEHLAQLHQMEAQQLEAVQAVLEIALAMEAAVEQRPIMEQEAAEAVLVVQELLAAVLAEQDLMALLFLNILHKSILFIMSLKE
jgi:hypothetical protein